MIGFLCFALFPQIRLLAPPRFVITLETDDVLHREESAQRIKNALASIASSLEAEGGEYCLVNEVSEHFK